MAIAINNGWKPGQNYDWSLDHFGNGAADASGFNLNPLPESGTTAFGEVPGQLGLPNPAGDLGKQIPNLQGLNTGASDLINSELGGQLSPATLHALQNAGATFGIQSGMPGSGLSFNRLYGNIAGATEARQRQGLEDYSRFIPTVSGTQTVRPELQNEIASQNALNKAAPNPAKAASYAQQLFDQYLQKMRGPGGGTGGYGGPSGGTGSFVPRSNPFSSPLPTSPYPTQDQLNEADPDPFAADFEEYNLGVDALKSGAYDTFGYGGNNAFA